MRLIDVDDLDDRFSRSCAEECGVCSLNYNYKGDASCPIIGEAPIIDAIPKDEITKMRNEIIDLGMGINQYNPSGSYIVNEAITKLFWDIKAIVDKYYINPQEKCPICGAPSKGGVICGNCTVGDLKNALFGQQEEKK